MELTRVVGRAVTWLLVVDFAFGHYSGAGTAEDDSSALRAAVGRSLFELKTGKKKCQNVRTP